MPKPELDQMVEDAYSDPEILEYLNRNFMYHYDRVIKRILKEHFKRLAKEEGCNSNCSK
jgi:hypothetical protein